MRTGQQKSLGPTHSKSGTYGADTAQVAESSEDGHLLGSVQDAGPEACGHGSQLHETSELAPADGPQLTGVRSDGREESSEESSKDEIVQGAVEPPGECSQAADADAVQPGHVAKGKPRRDCRNAVHQAPPTVTDASQGLSAEAAKLVAIVQKRRSQVRGPAPVCQDYTCHPGGGGFFMSVPN